MKNNWIVLEKTMMQVKTKSSDGNTYYLIHFEGDVHFVYKINISELDKEGVPYEFFQHKEDAERYLSFLAFQEDGGLMCSYMESLPENYNIA